jgi:hypothetical protein
MEKASEYREHAEECRMLAQRAKSGEDRAMLLNMAEIWESLAQTCEKRATKNNVPNVNPHVS